MRGRTLGFGFERPRPADVFTPGRLPLGRHNVYAQRVEPEKKLGRTLERGNVPLVYGEYGVGKTTLARKFYERHRDPPVYLTADDLTLQRVVQRTLEHIGHFTEQRRTQTRKRAIKGDASAAVAKVSLDRSLETLHEWSAVVSEPTRQRTIELMNTANVCLIIDEMHKASSDFRRELANFIKAVNGVNLPYPQIVLVGTTTDAVSIVDRDPGIDRIVAELRVRPLNDSEARFIVRTGFRILRLSVDDNVVRDIVRIAAGAPTIIHSICLAMAERAFDHDISHVARSMYLDALTDYVQEERNVRLTERYMKAIETTGAKRYRKCIIRAIAELEADYATLEDIRIAVSHYLGESVPANALSGPLRDLKSPRYGELLADVQRSQNGPRVYNLSRFADPTMKYFVRFLVELDKQLALPLRFD
jgi:hypothetical protein